MIGRYTAETLKNLDLHKPLTTDANLLDDSLVADDVAHSSLSNVSSLQSKQQQDQSQQQYPPP